MVGDLGVCIRTGAALNFDGQLYQCAHIRLIGAWRFESRERGELMMGNSKQPKPLGCAFQRANCFALQIIRSPKMLLLGA